ncbi:MAG: hypothetical protein ABR985_10220 [Methanotrichaceae archaeon]|jgi:hypothetical protein
MGRSFESFRMGAKEVSARWLKASRALKKEDQIYGQRLAEMVKKHSSQAFYAFDDPLEAAVFSMLVEMMKNRARKSALATTATQSSAIRSPITFATPPTPRPYPLSLQQC